MKKWAPSLIAGAFLVLAGVLIWQVYPGFVAGLHLAEEDERATVEGVVAEFGSRLKMVSLLAPPEMVRKSMESNYSDLVLPELIEEWGGDPLRAPGRLTSSPWPDRIEIEKVTKRSEGIFKVEVCIVEVTSQEAEEGGASARRSVTLILEKVDGRWLITAAAVGDYIDSEAVLYKNEEYGFSFWLPVTWKGYSVVVSKWTGITPPEKGRVVETGPLISIRHPDWREEKQRQDIPIMVFTVSQWNRLQGGEFTIGASPVGPTVLGCSSKYVFALPARYNYAFLEGFEEVERIIAGNPLKPHEETR